MKNENPKNVVTYQYEFKFNNGKTKNFEILLDGETLALIETGNKARPEWARLKFCRCPVCPFKDTKMEYCPIAININDIVSVFGNALSYEEVDVTIESENRKYMKHTSLQKGLSSLMGIYMVTSGCPVMEKLKPMVRYHMPFATPEETMYRVISMYLFAQYFLYKHGAKPDLDLKNLSKIYEDIIKVNKSFAERLLAISSKDASLNALTILHSFANFVSFSINEDMLNRIEYMFKGYLNAKKEG